MPTDPLRKLFGRNVMKRRKALSLTQGALATQTGLTGKYISEIERGVANTSLGVVEKIAAALDTSAPLLIDQEDDWLRQVVGLMRERPAVDQKRALMVIRSLFAPVDDE